METGKTVGDVIDEKVKTYKRLYDSFTKDESFKNSAKNLSLCDLLLNRFIAKQVLKEVEDYITNKTVVKVNNKDNI